MERMRKMFLSLLIFVLLFIVWETLASSIKGFPSPQSTYLAAFGGMDADDEEIEGVLMHAFDVEDDENQGIFWHLLSTLMNVFGGLGLTLMVGLPLGILLGMNRNLRFLLHSFIGMLKIISPLLWLPFVLLIFQDHTLAALFTVFMASLWPIIRSTEEGLLSVDEDYMKMSKVLQLSKSERFMQVILPLVVPYIFAGLKRSLSIAWIVALPVEMLLQDKGIGYWIWYSYTELMYDNILIGMMIVSLVIFMINLIVRKITNYFDYM